MKIAVISYVENNFTRLLSQYAEIKMLSPDSKEALDGFDSYAVLGGGNDTPLYLPIDMRLSIEKARSEKKPVFIEWCDAVGYLTYVEEIPTVSGRMLYVGENTEALCKGDLLDDHDNKYIRYTGFEGTTTPILIYGGHILKHDRTDSIGEYANEQMTLWTDDCNTMICSFRFCNYILARMSPYPRWDGIASLVISHLTGKKVNVHTTPIVSMINPPKSARDTFRDGMKWFDSVKIYADNGKGGAFEGFRHNIAPDGKQSFSVSLRNDCSGEVGAACFFDYYLYGNKESCDRFKNLQCFCFEKLYENEGIHKGMMRWCAGSWGTCYHDDVARAMLGTLLSMELTSDRKYLDKVCSALDYLVKTTGTDGLRVKRTDAQYIDEKRISELANTTSDFPCAHHNGYYMAVLLLAYKICGNQKYFDMAQKGITSLMAVFPDTIREHSETQELARLVLPLACLYEITKDKKHREYLYTVTERLEKYRHKNGGYIEYDTGYKAARSRTSGTESSLLADNGDPVCDLLYSTNWLPLGFAFAYRATKDDIFKERWQELILFLSSVQMKSDNPLLCGCWCRGIDLDRRESYGMPHDVGWGTCAVESGWTVAEILMGIAYGIILGMDK